MGPSTAVQPKELSWAVELPPEFAKSVGVAPGSIAVLSGREGKIEVEILPPPSTELEDSVARLCEKYREAFEEMKRLGD